MTRPPVNYVPAILLTGVSWLFAVTWSYDHPSSAETPCAAANTSVSDTGPVAYRAVTGLMTSGRASLRSTLPSVRRLSMRTPAANTEPVSVTAMSSRPAQDHPVPAPALPHEPADRTLDWFSRLLQNAVRTGTAPAP